jgi:hypothetical protein
VRGAAQVDAAATGLPPWATDGELAVARAAIAARVARAGLGPDHPDWSGQHPVGVRLDCRGAWARTTPERFWTLFTLGHRCRTGSMADPGARRRGVGRPPQPPLGVPSAAAPGAERGGAVRFRPKKKGHQQPLWHQRQGCAEQLRGAARSAGSTAPPRAVSRSAWPSPRSASGSASFVRL